MTSFILLFCAAVLAVLIVPTCGRAMDNRSIARSYPDQSYNARYYRNLAIGFEIQAGALLVVTFTLAGLAGSLR